MLVQKCYGIYYLNKYKYVIKTVTWRSVSYVKLQRGYLEKKRKSLL
jgi:hypothetical protein